MQCTQRDSQPTDAIHVCVCLFVCLLYWYVCGVAYVRVHLLPSCPLSIHQYVEKIVEIPVPQYKEIPKPVPQPVPQYRHVPTEGAAE